MLFKIREILRKLFVYPWKLWRTFSLVDIFRFLWAYIINTPYLRIYPRTFRQGIWMRPRTTDVRVAYEFFTSGELEIDWPLSRPPLTIIDAGANIGYASLLLKKRWPDAKIVAVEADQENSKVFHLNCGKLANVSLLQCGVWGTEDNLKLQTDSLAQGSWGLRFEPTSKEDPEGIPAISIPLIMDRFLDGKCDLLKMDIEGAETSVFSQPDMEWIQRVSIILVETHGDEAENLVRKVAARYGFAITLVGEKLMLSRS